MAATAKQLDYIDNSAMSPHEVVDAIRARLDEGPGSAFGALARRFDLRTTPSTRSPARPGSA